MPDDTATVDRDPYAVLAREHRLIERALDVLGRICDEAHRTRRLNAPDATAVIWSVAALDSTHRNEDSSS
jgi:hypothetical protein